MRAFITGVCGQDGTYLSEFLLDKGYVVHGFARRGSIAPDPRVIMHIGDLADPAALLRALTEAHPVEIYNLGAQSHVGASFLCPLYTMQVTALPILTILDYAKSRVPQGHEVRVYQASTSELFGDEPSPQNERTRLSPRSPYAVAKLAAHQTVKMYREAYGIYACSGILFNHESEIRPPAFVTRKITQGAARIKKKLDSELVLGNLNAVRDWGHAEDYVRAMWLMLQRDGFAKDYVIATGKAHSVGDFAREAFKYLGLDWGAYVKTSDQYARPSDVPHLLGDASMAKRELGWEPEVSFMDLIHRMVDHDMESL
jgi:GDPmannose 4,6-dehydratase